MRPPVPKTIAKTMGGARLKTLIQRAIVVRVFMGQNARNRENLKTVSGMNFVSNKTQNF